MDFVEKIEEIALDFPSYGYRRITAELHHQKLKVNHKRVLRTMRQENLLCSAERAFKTTTDSSHRLRKYPNLIDGLVLRRCDQIWQADITYIRIATSFMYLAAIIDGFLRKAIDYAPGRTLSSDLSAAALNDGISKSDTDNLIHNSDRGIQYCSYDDVKILKYHGISISMSAKANPYDNAKIESFLEP